MQDSLKSSLVSKQTTPQSTRRTALSRNRTDSKIVNPISQSASRNISNNPSEICIKFSRKRAISPVPASEPPYTLMRNGVPFLYTPVEQSEYRPFVVSPFGSLLKGSKIKARTNHGNMFAMHDGNMTERTKPFMIRTYLTMRSKWK